MCIRDRTSIAAGGDLILTDSGGATFGAVNADAVTLTSTTGTIAFQGVTTFDTGLTGSADGYNLSFTGGTTTIAGDTNLTHTGTLTLGDGGDTLTFTGGLDTTGVGGQVNVGGTVGTDGAQMDLGAITLTAEPAHLMTFIGQ